MDAKMVEIRDRATFIPALAIRLRPGNEQDRYLLSRAGYGRESEQQAEYILLVRVAGGGGFATSNPYEQRSRTLQQAHAWLVAHFDEIESGAVVDVEFIRGETSVLKLSEAEEETNA